MKELSDIYIVDNFVSNARDIRFKLDNSQWSTSLSPSGFQFNSAQPNETDIYRGLDEIERSLGLFLANNLHLSLYVYETKFDEEITRKKSWIHFDHWTWVGIHYLNLPDECRGGTSFYTHISTGLNRFSNEEVKEYPNLGKLFRTDGIQDNKWDCYDEVEMKWNRLILFNPKLFHAPSFYFGDDITDARKYQVYLFI